MSNAGNRPFTRRLALGVLLAAALSFGCGQLSIRTWVNVITEESGGEITLIPPPGQQGPPPTPITDLQGGFLGFFQVDTRDLPGALNGYAELEDVRIAGFNDGLALRICTWGDPNGASTGTVSLDLLSGASSVDLVLDAKAHSAVSALFGVPPVDFVEDLSLELGEGLGIGQFLQILTTGSVDGAFSTTSTIATTTTIATLPVSVALDVAVTNGPSPPTFGQFFLNFCRPYFEEQGTALHHSINSKSSYLLADDEDEPVEPIAIPLGSLGILPGDTVRLSRTGTFASDLLLRDGNETGMTGVFSATDVVLADTERHRVPDAIDAGNDFFTEGHWECVLIIFCTVDDTDIAEDFLIDPSVDVVVPAGAQYLIVAPYDDHDLRWDDNGGLALGVDVDEI